MLYADARSSLEQRRQQEEAAAAARVTARLVQAEATGERRTDGGAEQAHAEVAVLLRLLARVRASRANQAGGEEEAECAARRGWEKSSPPVTPWCAPTAQPPHSRRRQLHARTVELLGCAPGLGLGLGLGFGLG